MQGEPNRGLRFRKGFMWTSSIEQMGGRWFLMRGGSLLLLSSHGGDGEFGQAIVVVTDNVDALFHRLRMRGLKTPGNPDAPGEVHEGPIDQSWGTRELYVDDPDGNTLRFVEGFGISPSVERDA